MDQVRGVMNAQLMPRLNQSVNAVAQATASDWKEGVYRAKLWSGEKNVYMNSITWSMTGDFSAVVSSEYQHASEIENGRPARDLKRMLNTSAKVRQTKTGSRYLIIPFRHNTPSSDATGPAMPPAVYDLAKNMAPSSITGVGRRLSGLNASNVQTRKLLTVAQNKYKWGGRLDLRQETAWKATGSANKNHQGMYRFESSSGNEKRSTYLTFRVMSEKSSGWIVPPQAGLFIVRDVVARLQPLAERAFSEAVKRDLG